MATMYTPTTGLYLDDSTPLSSILGDYPAVVDGNYNLLAYAQVEWSIGFDLLAAGEVQIIRLHIDPYESLGPFTVWYQTNVLRVYKSSDNNTWTLCEEFTNPGEPFTASGGTLCYCDITLTAPHTAQYFKVHFYSTNHGSYPRMSAGGSTFTVAEIQCDAESGYGLFPHLEMPELLLGGAAAFAAEVPIVTSSMLGGGTLKEVLRSPAYYSTGETGDVSARTVAPLSFEMPTFAVTGEQGETAQLVTSLPFPTAAFTRGPVLEAQFENIASVFEANFPAYMELEFDLDAITFSAYAGGGFEGSFELPTISTTGTVHIVGSFSEAFEALTASGSFIVGRIGDISADFQTLKMEGTASLGTVAALSGSITITEFGGTGYFSISGDAAATMQALEILMTGHPGRFTTCSTLENTQVFDVRGDLTNHIPGVEM